MKKKIKNVKTRVVKCFDGYVFQFKKEGLFSDWFLTVPVFSNKKEAEKELKREKKRQLFLNPNIRYTEEVQ